MDTYDIYLKHEAGNVLPVEEAIEIYNSLVQSVALCTNEYKEEIVNELIEKSIKYSVVRAKWEVWNREIKIKEDEGRTLKHNSVIDAFNILARLIKSEDIDTSWRDRLGDDRKRIGDFACFLTYMVGINNR